LFLDIENKTERGDVVGVWSSASGLFVCLVGLAFGLV
jgi:hypothetical protein